MHYFAVAVIPATDEIEKAIAGVMAPYDERDGDNEDDGHWDWWVVGGRWTGVWGTNPIEDPDNYEVCWLCNGTGMRNDALGQSHRARHPEYTCNGCGHTGRPGRKLKFAPDWKRDPKDVRPVAELLADAEARTPHDFVSAAGWMGRERWTGSDFEPVADFDQQYRALLEANPDHLAVVVDYHT